jgi:hypothetical protein
MVTWSSAPSRDMAEVPMGPCPACGAPQPVVSIGIPAGEMVGNIGIECWNCGTRSEQRGTYLAESVDGDLRAIFYDADIQTLSRLREALLALQDRAEDLDGEDVVAAVEPVSPPAASWLRDRGTRTELVAAISALLTAIGVIIALMDYNKAPDPSPVTIEKLIVQIERGTVEDPGLPRKAPCWCGSGKRYKHCHAPAD